MPTTTLGAPKTGSIAVSGAQVRLFERGISLEGPAGQTAIHYNFPSLLRPVIRTGGIQGPAFKTGIRVEHAAGQLDQLRPLVSSTLDGRLYLRANGSNAASLRIAGHAPLSDGSGFEVEVDGVLSNRQIYDVGIRTDDGLDQVIAPNALYYRDDWTNFGIAHITDMHVARRIDKFRSFLRQAGLNDAANRMVNWNDRFRGFVKYANYLHELGKLDLILATGDLFDYIHEDDDDPNGGGNAEFLRQLILGQSAGPDFPDVERLNVPIHAVPGNHDYRKHPYRLIFDLNIKVVGLALKDLERVKNYSGYRLNNEEAKELANRLEGGSGVGVPNYSADEAGRMVAIDNENLPYRTFLGPRGSYLLELGPHKIVMLDTEWDAGVMSDLADGLRYWLSQRMSQLNSLVTEDELTFVGGSPNSEGIQDAEYELTTQALAQTNNGLFIVGLHAPLFNPSAYPYFLRQTQRPSQGEEAEAFLAGESEASRASIRSGHPTWFAAPNDHREIRFVKRVDTVDKLGYGVARDRAADLLRRLAGIDSPRPADVVLAGHTHRHNEFVVRPGFDGDLAFYMDFYTQNPSRYYPTRYMTSWKDGDQPVTDVTYVLVAPGVAAESHPWTAPPGFSFGKVVQIPPYSNPLNSTEDHAKWWSEHRPLVLQTGALGPIEDTRVNFSGFRMITVVNNVIKAINFISSDRLQGANYQLSWDDAITIEAPPTLTFLGRSEQFNMPAASGQPSACVLGSGAYDIIYRDNKGQLLELWREPDGRCGGGNLTGVAEAPLATGSPSAYVNTNANQIIVPYRAQDGVVHSVYSLPGGTGHDNLGGTANAPRAEGNPVGYYTAEKDLHHIIYRTSDGHLHSLYWQGNNVVAHEDLFWSNFPPAAGDPSPYSGGGSNIIAYRGVNKEIHTIYWSGDNATGHDSLSAVAGMPHAAGDPVAYHYAGPEGEVHQVTYRAIDGQLIELWWVGAAVVQGWSLTGQSGAPPSASEPAAYYNPESKKKHVLYTSADGHVHELHWTPGAGNPDHEDLTTKVGAPLAQGRPSPFFLRHSRTRHVVFRGRDEHIYEIVLNYRRSIPGDPRRGHGGPLDGGGVVVNS